MPDAETNPDAEVPADEGNEDVVDPAAEVEPATDGNEDAVDPAVEDVSGGEGNEEEVVDPAAEDVSGEESIVMNIWKSGWSKIKFYW